MHISNIEKETIITYNEAEQVANVYTYNGKLKRRLKEMSETHPEDIILLSDNGDGSVEYEFPKGLITIRAPRSEEYKEACRQRAIERQLGRK